MIQLRGISWDHPRAMQPLLASVQPYAEQFGVQVSWEARSLKDFGDAPIDALAEAYDILIVDHPHVGLAEATQCLVPLDTVLDGATLATLAEESAGPSHASYDYAGHQWALAIDGAVQTAAYRPDLLGDVWPDSWDAVIRLAETLRERGRWLAIPLVPTDCICSFLSLCASYGSPPGHGEGAFVDAAVGRQALDVLIRLKQLAHPACPTWNPIGMLNHMSSHDDAAYCPLTFIYSNYSRTETRLIRYGTAPGTKGACLGGTGYAISPRCQHIAEAAAYGVWLCSAEIQRTLYVREGGQPGNGVAWRDDEANRLTHDLFRAALPTLEQSYVRPRYNGWAPFQEEAGNVIHAMLAGGMSAQACLERIEALYAESRV